MQDSKDRKIILLKEVLDQENFLHTDYRLPEFNTHKFKDHRLYSTAEEVFKSLGGINMDIPANLGMHLQYQGLLIQIDDELHFNRYRKISLESSFYKDHSGFKVLEYLRNCRIEEKECIKSGLAGSNWHNPKAKKMFGDSEEPGDLSMERNGSSAWKLRAWIDFIQDISGEIMGYKVLRISVYDKLMVNNKIQSLGTLMKTSQKKNYEYIAKYLVRRIINIKGS